MSKGDQNPNQNKFENGFNNQSSFLDLLEGERAIRYMQNKFSLEEMKAKVLKQKIEQKKKLLEGFKAEVKRVKTSCDKNKDQIALLTRESAFLTEMINFSLKSINK